MGHHPHSLIVQRIVGIKGILVISGSSGAGKKGLVGSILRAFPDDFAQACSVTTRSPRPDETPGVEYSFVSRVEFLRMAAAGEFLEYKDVHGELYGTSIAEVQRIIQERKYLLLEIDAEGAFELANSPEPLIASAVFTVFITVSDIEILRARILRRPETRHIDPEELERRLATARVEMRQASSFHHVVNNDGKIEIAEAALADAVELFLVNFRHR